MFVASSFICMVVMHSYAFCRYCCHTCECMLFIYVCTMQADLCLLDGASELLQLMDVAAFVTRRLSGCAAEVDIKKHTH